ncbi:hypothetical protein [Streptococcus acidominimus]|uniref:Toxin-antitoxin system, toxin component, MazF family n=1 Tax=Streptococcus acidominimus TaxID=1326 RepID=A0A4Y9FRK5_STRAI|nr:hypothetical protein [Streptococcus acidominimus]MBF0817852.1 hypothetical protein [Streptococcus acidominimus]MBF0838368.1 hypothetical protein [Streptococcus acidominimus]MBF0846269.1 hypothetical protein [Streptococcus danieliae]TFU31841.1 hypothetical protein E4U01_00015 [Streptococcus acidominimus]
MQVKEFDVIISYVEYADGSGGKTRPMVVTSVDGETIVVRRITSKFFNKSEYIQQKYYEIKDWKRAGLKMPSWVDIKPPMRINKDKFIISIIGSFTKRDIESLSRFLVDKGE